MLALQTVLFILVVAVCVLLVSMSLLLKLRMLLVRLQLLRVHLLQLIDSHLKIRDQRVAASPAEVLTNDHSHHLQLLSVWCHRVGWNDPPTLSQLVCNGKLVE